MHRLGMKPLAPCRVSAYMTEGSTTTSQPSVFSPLARALLDGFSEGVIVFDAQGRVMYANQQAREALRRRST